MKAADMIEAAKVAGLIVAGWLAYRAWQKVQAEGIAGAVGSTVTGAVKGVGGVFGIPDTNASECAKAKAAGDTWGASFACPAGDFLGYGFDRAAQSLGGAVRNVFTSGSGVPKRQATQADHQAWAITQQAEWGGKTFNQRANDTSWSPWGLF